MKIALGADHRGSELATRLMKLLRQQGHLVEQVIAGDGEGMCDYPDVAYPVAQQVAQGQVERGILICGTGIGMCIVANKVDGVRAAVVHDEIGAEMGRRHNDANVLCLAADLLGARLIDRIVATWLSTTFEGGRHARRVAKIAAVERGVDPASVLEAAAGADTPVPVPGNGRHDQGTDALVSI